MSFISSSTDPKYLKSEYLGCLSISIHATTAKVVESFFGDDLEDLREELQAVINDIDRLLEEN